MKHFYTSHYFPLNFLVADMQPNILLMCKLFFLLLCAHGFVGYIEDPYIPFIQLLDVFSNYPNVFKITLKSLFLCSGILLLFNVKPRAMSIILGCAVILILLSSKSLFRNHLFICGCAFLLAGLSNKKGLHWLLYIQLSLVYFGAVTNKIFDIAWWNGDFMHNWLVYARENQLFILVSDFFPEMWLAKILSWSSMVIELTIAVLILIKKRHLLVAWIILLFHSILYTMTFFRFGHFYEDIVIILFIFLIWPKEKLKVYLNKEISLFFKQILNFFFNNSDIIYEDNSRSNKEYWLKVKTDKMTRINGNAFSYLLQFTPNFYLTLFLVDLIIRFLFNGVLMHVIHLSILWICILFFIPKFWKRNTISNA